MYFAGHVKTFLVMLCVQWTQCKDVSGPKCQFFDGIYTSVMRRIYNQGFHKELWTEVELMLTTSMLPPSCRIVIEETVPRGMYVDPDQLRDLEESQGLQTYVAANVDVEKPEFESESFRVYVFRHLRIQENLRVTSVTMPVHLRYHKPSPTPQGVSTTNNIGNVDGPSPASQQQPIALVKMQNPRLLLSCDTENVAALCPEKMVTSYCDASGTTKCEYLQIPYKVNVNAIEVSVPVGNSDHAPYVVALTTFIVSGATVYLLVALFREVEQKDK